MNLGKFILIIVLFGVNVIAMEEEAALSYSAQSFYYVSPKKTPEDDDCVRFSDDEEDRIDLSEVVMLQLPLSPTLLRLDAQEDEKNNELTDGRDSLSPVEIPVIEHAIRLPSFTGDSSITMNDIPRLYEAGLLIKIDEQNTKIAACGHMFRTTVLVKNLQYYSVCFMCNCSIFSK